MANSTSHNPWILDTIGVIKTDRIKVSQLALYPASAGNSATVKSWNENETVQSTTNRGTATVTGTATITSTGNFTAAKVTAGDVIKITESSTGNNLGTFLVATRDSDDAVTVTPASLTNEVASVYTWSIWTPYIVATVKSAATEAATEVLPLTGIDGTGQWFHNFLLSAISNASDDLYVYIV